MEPTTMLILFIIFAFIGFLTDLAWGLNVYKLYSDVGLIVFGLIISFIVLGVSKDPSTAIDATERIVNVFVNNLIPMVLGDAAGTFISNIVKSFKG